jgi:hypothetical protein
MDEIDIALAAKQAAGEAPALITREQRQHIRYWDFFIHDLDMREKLYQGRLAASTHPVVS